MSTHLSRLRRQCQPVQEDTPVVPREHRISVDKRDLLQLLADYDAALKDELLHRALSHAWGVDIKYNKDNLPREIKITLRDTCTMAPHYVDRAIQQMLEFVDNAPGAL
jgi:hypothetical protein